MNPFFFVFLDKQDEGAIGGGGGQQLQQQQSIPTGNGDLPHHAPPLQVIAINFYFFETDFLEG